MKRKSAEGPRVEPHAVVAANEDFDPTGRTASFRTAGWDAYEVWRTRVKPTAKKKPAHTKDERGPLP